MNSIPQIFNRKKVRMHRQRAARNIATHDFLINEVAERLAERLADIKRDFANILAIGNLSNALAGVSGVKLLVNQDISENMLKTANGLKLVADEEKIPFAKNSFDLVISNLALHLVNDLPGSLVQILQILKPNGLFIATMFGTETLSELRQVMAEVEVAEYGGMSPHISPFADVKTLGSLVQRVGFDMPVADSEIIKVSYENVMELMHDLRGMGEANALVKSGRSLSRKSLNRINELYKEKFGDNDGGIVVTFDIATITGLAAFN